MDGTDGMAAERLRSGRAWDDFCDVLRLAGRTVDEFGDQVSELDRAEWYRCLTRLMRVACERYLENAEPGRPRLRITPWRTSINMQSPDQDHLLCELPEPVGHYRITGQRGTVPYFIIAAMAAPRPAGPGAYDWAPSGFEGLTRFDPSRSRPVAQLSSDEMSFADDGSFTIDVGATRPAEGNHLPLPDGTVGLIVRTVHHDRRAETAPRFEIETVDGEHPRPIRADEVADGLAAAAQMTLGFVHRTQQWTQDLSSRPNHLEFSRQRHVSHGGIADRHVAFGIWQKPADMALVLEFVPPPCEYWNFQLCNIWQENLDVYEEGQGYVTALTANPGADGTVRVVIADQELGLGGNWVNSDAHCWGLMGLRFVKAAAPPTVRVRLVELIRLADPAWPGLDTVPVITTGELQP